MAVGENDGYDTILLKISQYAMIRYTVPKCSAVCNGQHSKINAAFSLTPLHAFACVQQLPVGYVYGDQINITCLSIITRTG